jgi:zinc/manganese transport system substrate-binding protein
MRSEEAKMKRRWLTFAGGLFAAGAVWGAPLKVVTTTSDLAALAGEVGGEDVEAVSLAKGYQDPHFVEAKPSFLLKLRDADLFIQIGLEMEVAWAPGLLANARNPRILPGSEGFLDASEGCEILQIPEGKVDRSRGDAHPLGNPHYWTDPENGRVIARSIARRLEKLRPEKAGAFAARLDAFEKALDEASVRWRALLEPHRGARVITYHDSWPNFVKRFGLEVFDFVEPKPGVPPSPQHVRKLEERMREREVKVILMEPYFDARLSEKIARETGARLLLFPPSVGGAKEIGTYIGLFDANLRELAGALKGER